jgi:hypothetical protein
MDCAQIMAAVYANGRINGIINEPQARSQRKGAAHLRPILWSCRESNPSLYQAIWRLT